MHFTPTGSSWINQVERWFGFLTDQMIRRGAHKSVQALEKDIRAWVEGWNADPKPFVWKKTAEEKPGFLADIFNGFQARDTRTLTFVLSFPAGIWGSGAGRGWSGGCRESCRGEAPGHFTVDDAQCVAERGRGLGLVAGHERAQDPV